MVIIMSNVIEKISKHTLPVVPLRDVVVFPNNAVSCELDDREALAGVAASKREGLAFFVTFKPGEAVEPKSANLFKVGTVGRIKQMIKISDKKTRVIIEGSDRAVAERYIGDRLITADLLVKQIHSVDNCGLKGEACIREAISAFKEIERMIPKLPTEVSNAVKSIKNIDLLSDFLACHVFVDLMDKQEILEEFDPLKRLQNVVIKLYQERGILRTELEIRSKVQDKLGKNQRDMYLREQLRVIKGELGEDEASEIDELSARLDDAKLPAEVDAKLRRELTRMENTPFGSAELTVSRNYIETCLDIPWTKTSKDRLDIAAAKKILDADHDGIEKVKDRILEYLAVRAISPNIKSQIICLVGPPGVGKTSIGASIAKALGRKYVRVSLGGVHDESEIRGHRKTYVGAMPGRIINALIQAGTKNPVMLLDEIDKLGQSHNGDPSSAMLEVLDGEQNKTFRDNFVELPVDLSDCMFIATANSLEGVPKPLIDRMEIIEMNSYTRHEKLAIASNHMVGKQLRACGLNRKKLKITDGALLELIDYYTYEAGVRSLERKIAALCRKAARRMVEDPEIKHITIDAPDVSGYLGCRKCRPDTISAENEVGTVNGLAYTEAGGDLLRMEALVMDGSGKLELTGSLGDVMKESAHIAVSFVRSRAASLGIDPEFYKQKDIHIHFPEGAVPKDGPSAGVTMVCAVASALSGIPVRRDVAMTGEVTLRGKVLAIGGLREKTMAAYSAGVKCVLIPEENLPDLEEIDLLVKQSLEFIPCRTADDVLEHALVREEAEQTTADCISVSDRVAPAARIMKKG